VVVVLVFGEKNEGRVTKGWCVERIGYKDEKVWSKWGNRKGNSSFEWFLIILFIFFRKKTFKNHNELKI
jgi:hypothetical protein